MTTENETQRASLPPPPPRQRSDLPPPTTSRYDRFRGEVMAGGAVTEREPSDEPFGGGASGLIGGIAIIGLFVWLGFANPWMLLFALGILVSVFLHELGHFLTARMTGMKATQFFIGFGPRLWSFHRGETEYGVRLLPLGAFVRIVGMNNLDEVPPADEARTYRQKSFPKRLLVISAGSLMHMLVAIVLLFGVFSTRGELVDREGSEVMGVADGSGADAAGIEDGDIVLSIDGLAIEDGDLGAAVRESSPGDTVPVVFERDGQQRTVNATLGTNEDRQSDYFGTALLGVTSAGAVEWRDMSIGEAARSSVTDLFPVTWESTKGIVKVINPINIVEHLSGESDDLSTRPTTVVGITQVSGDVGELRGFAGIVYLLAVLNVFVGVFNMFPLLPLDGGHAAIAVYERVREIGRGGRRYFTDVAKLMPFTMGVIVVLLFLFMSGLYLDITNPL